MMALGGSGGGGGGGGAGGALTPGQFSSTGFSAEANYEVFDPLNWMLDGFVDWPFPFAGGNGGGAGQGMEATAAGGAT